MADVSNEPERNKVYDSGPVIKPNLNNLEKSANPTKSPTASQSAGKSLSASNLKTAESGTSFTSTSRNQESLWNPKTTTKTGTFHRSVGFIKSHKKATAGGVFGIGAIIAAFVGYSFISVYTLDSVAHNDVSYEARAEQLVEETVGRRLMSKILCWKNPSSCKGDDEDESEEPTAESGEDLTSEMEDFDFTNPTIADDLGDVGIKVEEADGKFDGLYDTKTDEAVTSGDILDDTGDIDQTLEDGMPEWQVGQVEGFRAYLYDISGADWDILTDQTGDKVDQDVDQSIEDGAQGEAAAQQASEEEGAKPQNETAQEAEDYQNINGLGADLANAENTVESDVQQGESVDAAVASAAEEDFGISEEGIDDASATVAATDACMLQAVVTAAADTRIPEIMNLLIRNGTTTISLASQINSGELTGSEYSQVMDLYQGDPNAPAGSLDAQPFSASEAWQNITDQPVTNETPGIDESSLPTEAAGDDIVSSITGDLNDLEDIPGETDLCSLTQGIFGSIINGVGGAVSLIGNFFDLGIGDAVTIGAITAFQLALTTKILPAIIEYFMPVQLMGNQNAVERMNDTDAGLNLAYNNYSRSMGGIPQGNSEADSTYSQATNEVGLANSKMSLYDRTLDISNPDSLIAKIGLDMPVGVGGLLTNISRYLTSASWLNSIVHYLSVDLFPSSVFAQSSSTNPGMTYGLTQYGFNGDQNEYDPVANEQYLFSNVCYTIPIPDGPTFCGVRINMLGNPNTVSGASAGSPYTASGDSNTGDLLHCFVDSYSQIMVQGEPGGSDSLNFKPGRGATEDSNLDHNCGVIGLYDYSYDQISSNMSTASSSDSEMPDNYTAASIYCNDLLTGTWASYIPDCIAQKSVTLSNDVGHYEQYLLDLHVMGDYTSLTNSNP